MKIFLISFAVLLLASVAEAQGMMPGAEPAVAISTAPLAHTLLLGEQIPKGYTVTAETGQTRTVLSYKTRIDILMIMFLSTQCPEDTMHWGQLARFYENAKGWKVEFVFVNVGPPDTAEELKKRMTKAGLIGPLVTTSGRKVADDFGVKHVPTLMIADEGGYLRYRGPANKYARQAFEDTVGHIFLIKEPEPPFTDGCPLP